MERRGEAEEKTVDSEANSRGGKNEDVYTIRREKGRRGRKPEYQQKQMIVMNVSPPPPPPSSLQKTKKDMLPFRASREVSMKSGLKGHLHSCGTAILVHSFV